MAIENISQEFRLKNYSFKEIDQNELMSKKHKNVSASSNYIEQFLNLSFPITECVSISSFYSLRVL